MHRLARIGVAGAIRHAPAHGLLRAGLDLVLAVGKLLEEKLLERLVSCSVIGCRGKGRARRLITLRLGVGAFLPAPGIHDAEEVPAQFGFAGRVEGEGDHPAGKGAAEEGGEPGAHAGGIHDDGARLPEGGERFQLGIQAGVARAHPQAAFARAVGGAADKLVGETGEVDLDDGQRGGIAARVGQGVVGGRAVLANLLVLPGHIQQEGIETARLRVGDRGAAVAVGLHQRDAAGAEHAAIGIDLLAEILGAHHGMIASQKRHLFGDVFAVFRHLGCHFLAAQLEDPLDMIAVFGTARAAQLAPQQGLAGPGGAPEDARGVGGSRHGRDLLVVFADGNVLGFVHFQQGGGCGAHDVAFGRGGKKGDARLADAVNVTGFPVPERAGERVVLEHAFQAAHGVLRLRVQGG